MLKNKTICMINWSSPCEFRFNISKFYKLTFINSSHKEITLLCWNKIQFFTIGVASHWSHLLEATPQCSLMLPKKNSHIMIIKVSINKINETISSSWETHSQMHELEMSLQYNTDIIYLSIDKMPPKKSWIHVIS